jgi:hypothetical protein
MAYTKYSLTPANNTATPPDGAPEGMLPSAVNDTMRDMMAQIRDCGDGVRDGTYTMTAPKITGGTITGATLTGNTFTNPVITGGTFTSPVITGGPLIQNTAATLQINSTTAAQPAYLLLSNSTDSSNGYLYAPNKQLGVVQSDVSASSVVYFSTQNTERARIDSAGNVGIGTSSPTNSKLDVEGRGRFLQDASATTGAIILRQNSGDTVGGHIQWVNNANSAQTGFLLVDPTLTMIFGTSGTERMRIDSSGNLLVGTTSAAGVGLTIGNQASNSGVPYLQFNKSLSGNVTVQYFYYNGSGVGTINVSDTATAYNTSSDYRLKENIVPMTGALAKVALLKPCTYKWKVDGSDGQGFIAHELVEVVPDCVTGEKDAVDVDGKPQYQGVDTSFLVATLTKAIQEQQALIESLTTRLTALENK